MWPDTGSWASGHTLSYTYCEADLFFKTCSEHTLELTPQNKTSLQYDCAFGIIFIRIGSNLQF